MSDSAHLQSISSDEEEDDVYYSDSDENTEIEDNLNNKVLQHVIQSNQLMYDFTQNVVNTIPLRRPQEVANTSTATQTNSLINNNINCCLVHKNLIKSQIFSDSKNCKTFNDLENKLINALDVMKCDQRLTYKDWESKLEFTFRDLIFNSCELSANHLNEMLLSFDSLIDSIRKLCAETKTTREVSTQTDISGLIIMEDIFHE